MLFELDAGGESRRVDASRWRCVLGDVGTETFDLTVYALFTEDLDEQLRASAVERVLHDVLGERRGCVKIAGIKLTLDPDQATMPIISLAQHLDERPTRS